MSQTTRCPACQTRFKVVADQLRISDGWVRCGNCQQVFDASLSLQPAEPEAMLPDMPLDQLRGPVARAAPPALAARAWGSAAATPPAPPPPAPSEEGDGAGDGFAQTQPGVLDSLGQSAAPEPPVHVPSFLKAPIAGERGFLASSAGGLAWQGFASGQAQTPAATAPVLAQVRSMDGAAAGVQTAESDTQPRSAGGAGPQPALETEVLLPGGYELPAAQVDADDSDWPALFDETAMGALPSDSGLSSSGSDAPELDLAHFMAELAQGSVPEGAQDAGTEPVPQAPATAMEEPAWETPEEAAPDRQDPDWTLVQDGPSGSALGTPDPDPEPIAGPLQPPDASPSVHGADADHGAQEPLDPDMELSFVRRARRRAFWAGKGVRAGLALSAVLLVLGLAGQMALLERARLAASWPQSRSVLESACAYLQCSVGLHRDIGAVLVDGSSFNRTQGDRYQFSLTLRNRSALPVEAPAIELTLTDAQDQPVLRRILLPAELAAPNPLRAGQEWSTVTPITIGEGAARIAGYRVLAFYP